MNRWLLLFTAIAASIQISISALALPQLESVAAAGTRLDGRVTTKTGPLIGAMISLEGAPFGRTRATLTDSDGRFALGNVTHGEYRLSVTKLGYVIDTVNGVKWLGLVVPVSIVAAQVPPMDIGLARGGVIAGTVFDAAGRPLPVANVSVLRIRASPDGSQGLSATLAFSTVSDGHGRYRAYGLPLGQYVVKVEAGGSLVSRASEPSVRSDQSAAGRVDDSPQRRIPTYFGSSSTLADATKLQVMPSQIREGIDINLLISGTATVRGTIVAEGYPAQSVRLRLGSADHTQVRGSTMVGVDQEGKFIVRGLAPGRYEVSAVTQPGPGLPGAAVTVDATLVADQALDLVLTLAPLNDVAGRVLIGGQHVPIPKSIGSGLGVTMRRSNSSVGDLYYGAVDADGTFHLKGLPNGKYKVTLTGDESGRRSPLFLRSVVTAGQPAHTMEVTLPLTPAGTMVLDMWPKSASLSGRVVTRSVFPIAGLSVVLVSQDGASGGSAAGEVRFAAVDVVGKYSITGLAPGAYLLAVVASLDVINELSEIPLVGLRSVSMPIEIAEGESATRDLAIGDGSTK